MEVAYVLCARASTRAPWVPVPTTRRGSLDCATLSSSKSPWALNVLKGAKKDRDTCDATLVLKAFESDVRVRVASLTAADASPPSAKKPRLLESDSEPDEPDADSQPSNDSQQSAACSHAAQRRKVAVDKVGFTKIELDGFQVDVGFHKGPGVQVQASAETVKGLLNFLDQQYDVLLAAGRDLSGQRLAARKDGPHEILKKVPPRECRKETLTPDTTAASDTNKIRFCFHRVAFKLRYFDGSSMKSVSKGFEVPRTDVLGNILSRDEYAKLKASILCKARVAWNALDQSDAKRFDAPTSSDVVSACSPNSA